MSLWNNHKKHKGRVRETEEHKIFNLKKVSDAHLAVSNTFDHTASLLKEIRRSLDVSFDALFDQDVDTLNRQRKKVKQNCSRFSTNPFSSTNSCQSHIINLILRTEGGGSLKFRGPMFVFSRYSSALITGFAFIFFNRRHFAAL